MKGAKRRGDCRALLNQIFGYLDGELSPGDAAALEGHLADCHCCGPFARGLRDTMIACRVAGAPALPRDVQARARARVRALLKDGALPAAAAPARAADRGASASSRARRPAPPSRAGAASRSRR